MEAMDLTAPVPYAGPIPAFWQGRRVLVTGHTGIKGAWLTHWLLAMGARVTGLSLAPATEPSLFEQLDLRRRCDSRFGDIRDAALVRQTVQDAAPEVVLHLAAQALVRASYAQPLDTLSSNVLGTAHVLDALRGATGCRVAVMVTTDKVYRNREWVWPYREDDPLGGHDPYSASKAACELVIDSWRLSFLQQAGTAVASARAGNIIGGGDWSAERLLPDAVRAWQAGQPVVLRQPLAVRPWQHVLDALAGYLVLAERLWDRQELAGAYNFGPPPDEVATVRTVIEKAATWWPGAQVDVQQDPNAVHEAGLLALDPSRAAASLGVRRRWPLERAVERTVGWYRGLLADKAASVLCEADLRAWSDTR